MSTWIIALAAFVVVNTLDVFLWWRFQCTCGRSRPWYYEVRHGRAGVMLGRAIWNTFVAAVVMLSLSWITGPLLCLLATYYWRCWWFHEKDKMKRKAARALGKVSINEHGRLAVKEVSA